MGKTELLKVAEYLELYAHMKGNKYCIDHKIFVIPILIILEQEG